VAFAVGSTFLSRVGFDLLYIVLMTVTTAELVAQRNPGPSIEEQQSEQAVAV